MDYVNGRLPSHVHIPPPSQRQLHRRLPARRFLRFPQSQWLGLGHHFARRGRDDPQTITSPDDMLSLLGPNRELAATGSIFFEINLRIKDGGTKDKCFSKCMIEHIFAYHNTQPKIHSNTSHMSTVELACTHVGAAVEARVEVSFLNELCNFNGKVIAWTTEDVENPLILYDSEAAGATTTLDNDGLLPLSRCLVAVPLDEELVLDIYILHEDKHLVLNFDQSDEACVCNLGSIELQVNVTWTAGMIKRRYFRLNDIRYRKGHKWIANW